MKILARILALFLIMPVVELFLLIKLEEYTDQLTDGYGLLITLGLILLTGVAGSYLAKHQGLSVWNQLNDRLSSGGLPGKEVLDGVIILVAGALLITPGVITDFVGFMGLIPFTRAPIRRYVMKRLQRSMEQGTMNIGFGSFGSATYTDPSFDEMPHEGMPYDKAARENGWTGDARQMPRHVDDVESPSSEQPSKQDRP